MGHSAYAGSGGISGDSFVYKEIGGARYVMALSDGMGKGSEAASESSLAVNTLLLLIEAGFSVENALKTINSVLLMRSADEIFSTIDLGILDLDTGRLKLLKMGSSPTFIKSGDKVRALRTSALPMGIVDGLSLDFINVRLHPGDRLIMVSDGIADSLKGDAGGSWLSDTIANIRSQDPQTMADLIMNRAVENYGIKEKDDLTVLTFKVEE